MIYWILGFILLSGALSIPIAYAQETITVNQTDPCFLNYTAGSDLWQNCGVSEDYLGFALMGFEWVLGGFFSMLIVSLLIMVSYIKYHKAAYPMMIGVMFLPTTYFLFPEIFLTWAIILTIFSSGIFVWYAFIKQTKEY